MPEDILTKQYREFYQEITKDFDVQSDEDELKSERNNVKPYNINADKAMARIMKNAYVKDKKRSEATRKATGKKVK